MKTIENYKVIRFDDGEIYVYNDMNIRAPAPIEKVIVEWFQKKGR